MSRKLARIELKFKTLKILNLASLSGNHYFDFTDKCLFAITGKTGAGKSTILNAITLALYGELYNKSLNQNDLISLGQTESSVELEFEFNQKTYLAFWTVRLTKKSGEFLKQPFYKRILKDEENILDLSVADLIGLTFAEFCQTVILHQGEFSKFLNSSPAEKRQLLEKIFNLTIFSQIAPKLRSSIREIEYERQSINSQLSHFPEDLLTFLKEAPEAKSNLEIKIEQKKKNIEHLKKQLDFHERAISLNNKIEQISSEIVSLKATQKTQVTKKNKLEKHIESINKIVDQRQKVLAPKIFELKSKVVEKQTLENKLKITKQELLQSNKKIQAIGNDKSKNDLKINEINSLKEKLSKSPKEEIAMSSIKEIEKSLFSVFGNEDYDSLSNGKNSLNSELNKLNNQIRLNFKCKNKAKLSKTKLKQLKERKIRIEDSLFTIFEKRKYFQIDHQSFQEKCNQKKKLQNEINTLKTKLKNLPARSSNLSIKAGPSDLFFLKNLINQSIEKKTCIICHSNNLHIEKMQNLLNEIDDLKSSTKQQENPENIEKKILLLTELLSSLPFVEEPKYPFILKFESALKEALLQIEKNENLIIKDLEIVTKQRNNTYAFIAKAKHIKSSIKDIEILEKRMLDICHELTINFQIPIKHISTAKKTIEQFIIEHQLKNNILEKIESIQKDFKTEDTNLHDKLQILHEVKSKQNKLLSELKAKNNELQNFKIEDLNTFQHLMDKGLNYLKTTKEKFQQALVSTTQTNEKLQSLIISDQENRNSLVNILNKIKVDNFSREEEQINLETLTQELNQHLKEIGRLQEKIAQYSQSKSLFTKLNKQKKALIDFEKRQKDLYHSLDGDGFRQYALSHLEQQLLVRANFELKNICHGRYELILTDAGKDYLLCDHFHGSETRKVATLSGGETFLVSLCMALGLSDMARGANNLESFFIDEGFGTLDESCIEEILQTLFELTDRGKQVGLISHITSLTDAIPAKIHINWHDDGSRSVSTFVN